jgi:5-methyltetrahydrofolate--homocysteine methyltransferase
LRLDWKAAPLDPPGLVGRRVLADLPLEELVPYIDWSPFFHVWELRGVYPGILDHPEQGQAARDLWKSGRELLDRIVRERLLTARGVYGIFPANSDGEDIVLYADESRKGELVRFHTLRQQAETPDERPRLALSDFIAPRESGRADHLGAFAVTAGAGLDSLVESFQRDHDDYRSILAKALADRLAEAFAERLHELVRREWGYGRGENLSKEELWKEKYRGIRPAPGYPACPDHTEKRALWQLLDVAGATGIELTESFAMHPAASVSGLYFAHPEARYFSVGKIGLDQAADYAARKGMPLEEIERWLAPNLT